MSQKLFFNKNTPKCVWADSLEKCPKPITDWTEEKPVYPDQETQSGIVSSVSIASVSTAIDSSVSE
jgi:hypothetical protein